MKIEEAVEARERRRRIIFNNDGDDALYFPDEAPAQELLARRTLPVAET